MASRVFISYRRDDSAGHAGRVHDRLERELGRNLLFMDVDAIPLGVNFLKVLRDEVAKCDVLLAVIGPNWLGARDDQGNRRLDDRNDFLRIEIATALQRDIRVIPILLDGARIPNADQLPEDLEELARRAGLDVRHASFHSDMDKLIRELKGSSEQTGATTAARSRSKEYIRPIVEERVEVVLAVAAWLVATVVFVAFVDSSGPKPGDGFTSFWLTSLLTALIALILRKRKRLLEGSGFLYSLLVCTMFILNVWVTIVARATFGPKWASDTFAFGSLLFPGFLVFFRLKHTRAQIAGSRGVYWLTKGLAALVTLIRNLIIVRRSPAGEEEQPQSDEGKIHKIPRGGKECPQCGELMERRSHRNEPTRLHYSYWDWCPSCKRRQYYPGTQVR
jgi:hypothetical protein